MIRTFIGVELDEDTRGELAEEINYLTPHAPKLRWVVPENLHITLKFLGNVPENDLQEVFEAADIAAEKSDAFALNICSLGCLPDARRMRVVYAAAAMGSDWLTKLALDLETEFAHLGYPPEKRRFKPHITIARAKTPHDGKGIIQMLDDATNTDFGIVDVENVTVFMSELGRGGPRYTAMHRATLGE